MRMNMITWTPCAIPYSMYLNIVLLGHVAPAGRVEEWVEPHCNDVAKDFGFDEFPVQEAVEALSEEVSLPVSKTGNPRKVEVDLTGITGFIHHTCASSL